MIASGSKSNLLPIREVHGFEEYVGALRPAHLIAMTGETVAQRVFDACIVINDEDACLVLRFSFLRPCMRDVSRPGVLQHTYDRNDVKLVSMRHAPILECNP